MTILLIASASLCMLAGITALAGWGWTNWKAAEGILAMAKAFDIQEKTNSHIDDRIASAVARFVKQTRGPSHNTEPDRKPVVLDDVAEFFREQQRGTIVDGQSPSPPDLGGTILGEMPVES